MTDRHRISNGLEATIGAAGAELCALDTADGTALLWDAGPAWPSHSPILFPIVGQVAGDHLRIDGRTYPMKRHGFARRRRFDWVTREADRCSLVLRDDDETRAVYPFAFRLTVAYRIDERSLSVDYTVENPGSEDLPFSLGAHPAFRWPLHGGAPTDYRLDFALDEPAPVHRLTDGLLDPAPQPNPMEGRTLPLDPALFEQDALILLEPRSRSLDYRGPGGGLRFAWDGFPHLGLWQKPGGAFICLEPWQGYASPLGWDGEFRDKPGVSIIPPGGSRTMGWRVEPTE